MGATTKGTKGTKAEEGQMRMPRNGKELVEYWEREGLFGSRPDIEDAQEHARRLRRRAERRRRDAGTVSGGRERALDGLEVVDSGFEGAAMKKIQTSVSVAQDGHVEFGEPVRVDLPPGRHRALVLVDEAVGAAAPEPLFGLKDVDWSDWPDDARFSRDELYGKRER